MSAPGNIPLLQALEAFPEKINSVASLKPHLFYAAAVLCLLNTALNSNICQGLMMSVVTHGYTATWHCAVGGTFSFGAKIMNICMGWSFFACLMETTKEEMVQHTWFEMEFLGIIGNTYFSPLCLAVDSDIRFGVWVFELCCLVGFLPPHSFISEEKKMHSFVSL